jgi:hypothetical protein
MRQRVSIDLDEVIIPTFRFQIGFVAGSHPGSLISEDTYYGGEHTWGLGTREEAIAKIDEALWTEEYLRTPPDEETLTWLGKAARWNELHINTSRSAALSEPTRELVARHMGGLFAGIHHLEPGQSKMDIVEDIGAVAHLDDHPKHLKDVVLGGKTGVLIGTHRWSNRAARRAIFGGKPPVSLLSAPSLSAVPLSFLNVARDVVA